MILERIAEHFRERGILYVTGNGNDMRVRGAQAREGEAVGFACGDGFAGLVLGSCQRRKLRRLGQIGSHMGLARIGRDNHRRAADFFDGRRELIF